MEQFTGNQELSFLVQAGGDAARLATLARATGVLADDADPDLANWEACLLDLRCVLSGPRISLEMNCPDCGEGVALNFVVDDLPRKASPVVEEIAGVRLRTMHLSDLQAIEATQEDRLQQVLMRATGKDAVWAESQLTNAPAETVAALERCIAGLDLQLGTQCTECKAGISAPFDVQAFLIAERNGTGRILLDEVHMIAQSYHWSESEILSLPRDRRLAYLARIERDALKIELSDVGY